MDQIKELEQCIGKLCGVPELELEKVEDGYWRAYDMETYDGAPDGSNGCGIGKTPYSAVIELLYFLDNE